MNIAILEGRLGRDPELRVTSGGQKVANFTMATSQRFVDRKTNTRTERTQWHRVTCWGNTAERVVQYLKKGRHVLVRGRIEYSQYEDKDKVTRFATAIIANEVVFLDTRAQAAAMDASRKTGQQPSTSGEEQSMDVGDYTPGDEAEPAEISTMIPPGEESPF